MSGRAPIRRVRVLAALALAGAAAGGLFPSMARAAPGQNDTGSTIAHVNVTSSILLSDLTPSFTLVGIPGSAASTVNPISMRVVTNNISGYAVSVQPETATLDPAAGGNAATIPVSDLLVRETGTTPYTPLDAATPVVVHSQPTQSAENGDLLENDYSITMPWAAPDRYTGELDYVATTL